MAKMFICMVTITEKQRDYVRQNGYKPSQIIQNAIDMMMGAKNPFFMNIVKGIVKELKEGGALK